MYSSVHRASLIAQSVKNPPAMQESSWVYLVINYNGKEYVHIYLYISESLRWVRFLGPEDPLEKEMATHYSILAWKILWTEEPGGLQSMGLQVRHDLAALFIIART